MKLEQIEAFDEHQADLRHERGELIACRLGCRELLSDFRFGLLRVTSNLVSK
jgi:hypothetical protein